MLNIGAYDKKEETAVQFIWINACVFKNVYIYTEVYVLLYKQIHNKYIKSNFA